MEETISRQIRVSKSTEKSILIFTQALRCKEIHQKKLNEIKRANTVKRGEETKKVDEYINRRHNDKMRTAEFMKQGNFCYSSLKERDMEVNRGNKKLLERLVEISKGKHVKQY